MEEIINKLPDGTLLTGKSYQYRIVRALGQGSFGITYLATVKMVGALGVLDSNMYVCIKEFFMKGNNGRQGTMVSTGSDGGFFFDYKRKFMHEASNLSRLHHSGIIKVLEDFEANNTAYYVMEFIDGGSLNDYIFTRGGLPIAEAVELIRQVGEALSYMHSMKMLHLDLKPGNIMRRKSGEMVLIDFGLSKQYNENDRPETSTHVGQGTPGYAPLEQMSYRDGRDFPVTMDVYALTGTFYKMLTGYPPRDASDILNYGLDRQPLIERGVGEDVIALIEKGLSPIKFNRHQSVDEFLQAVNQLNVSPYQPDETIYNIPEVIGVPLSQVHDAKNDPTTFINGLSKEKMERTARVELWWGVTSEEQYWYVISRDNISCTRDRFRDDFRLMSWAFKFSQAQFDIFLSRLYTLITTKVPDVDEDVVPGGPWYGIHLFDNNGKWIKAYAQNSGIELVEEIQSLIPKEMQDPMNADSVTVSIKGVEFEMIRVQGGTFMMGINDAEEYERPVHEVALSSYFIGETPVTQELWKKVMGENPSEFGGAKRPVEYVSWEECQEFIQKLSEITGQKFRLPTEAEWEYAARGGKKSKGYEFSGSNNIDDVAWYGGASDYETHDVAMKSPNELGLYDMSGNVLELCQDWYDAYPSEKQSDPKGPSSGSKRVARGGCWDYGPQSCRNAIRFYISPSYRSNRIGLRLAL